MGKNQKRVDYIAKYSQRHRGPPPKRRTDFSNFICSSSAFLSYSKSSPDSVLELSSYAKDELVKSRRLFPCNELEDMGCDVSDTPPKEMEPRLSQDVQADLYLDRDAERSLEHDISMKSGEAAAERVSLKALWKPRVVNSSDSRDSREQVLKSQGRENVSGQQLMPSDRWNSSNSSEADNESSERGRGKRMRKKPKIYLDEEEQWSIAVKASSSKVRRIRIMRYLGLMAPVGSPF